MLHFLDGILNLLINIPTPLSGQLCEREEGTVSWGGRVAGEVALGASKMVRKPCSDGECWRCQVEIPSPPPQACGGPYGLSPASVSHQRAHGRLHVTAQKQEWYREGQPYYD